MKYLKFLKFVHLFAEDKSQMNKMLTQDKVQKKSRFKKIKLKLDEK